MSQFEPNKTTGANANLLQISTGDSNLHPTYK